MPIVTIEVNPKETRPWMMETKFWIGEQRMEMFKLWLASRITLFSHKAPDTYWRDRVKMVLNSLGDTYLNEQANTWYANFVDDLADSVLNPDRAIY